MLYRDFTTQEAIDREYDPMRGRDPAALLGDWQARSDALRKRCRVTENLAFGPTLAECMDVYHAEAEVRRCTCSSTAVTGARWAIGNSASWPRVC